MARFAADLMAAADHETIEAIVVGPFGWNGEGEADETAYAFERDDRTPLPLELQNKALTWEQAFPYLDYSYDAGFGAAECHMSTAWTKSWVLYVHEYDGSTTVMRLPRNPPNTGEEGTN